jgi:hypothetical protein
MIRTRLIATALTLAFAGVLGGCSSTPSWDPTDLMDFLDTKKPVPGVRKPVFPEGVPGMSQGVPKELIKGSPEANAAEANLAGGQATPPVETQPAPPPQQHQAPAKRTRTTQRARPAQPQVEIAPDDVNVESEPPPTPRRQTSRARTAQPPQQQEPVAQQQSSPFPAPLPR